MKKIQSLLMTGIVLATAFTCVSCGTEKGTEQEVSDENAGQEGALLVSSDNSQDTNAVNSEDSSKDAAAWAADGNYVAESGEYLIVYKTNKEYGASKDGWGALFINGEKMFNGELDESEGKLSGVLGIYTENGSPDEEMFISLADMGDYILLQDGDGKEWQFKPDTSDYSDVNYLPIFSYNQVLAPNGYKPLEAAAYDYLTFEYKKDYDTSHALIPYVNIVYIDESNPKDVLLYGDYYLWEFEKQGDTIIAVSGGHCPGVIHLERFGEGEGSTYTATGKMDEAYTDNDAKTIFGQYYENYWKLSSDSEIRDLAIAKILADYVSVNDLDITKYILAGDEAKELPTASVKQVKGTLPKYEYPGPEQFYTELYQYLIDSHSDSFSDEVCIPCPMIVYEDMRDDNEILVYGDFWICNYYLDGGILKCSSSGSYPGCIHMKKTEAGFEVTGMDEVGDGSEFEPTAQSIFGEYYEDFLRINEDTKSRNETRAQIIANYVAANSLSITAFQDYGWDPVMLPKENIDSFYSDLN